MKTKNITLGILAFTLGIGSSFASLMLPTNAYIHVRYSGQQNFTCIQVGQCDDPGLFACSITVPDLGMNVPAHPSTCVTNLTHNSSTPPASYDDAGTIVEAK